VLGTPALRHPKSRTKSSFSAICKAALKQCTYRSAEALHPITPKPGVLGTPALRHPKARTKSSFSAICKAALKTGCLWQR